MYCSNCGNYIDDTSKFCSKCGNKILDDNFNLSAQNTTSQKEDNSKLLNDISIALPIYKHLSDLHDEITKLQYKKNKKWNFLLKYITFFIGFFYGIMMIPSLQTKSSIVLFLPIIMGLMTYFGIKYLVRRYYQSEINSKTQEIEEYTEKHTCSELYSLPERYRNYVAAKFIFECLSYGRADTLKEAMNLYEQQLYMWEVEEKQQHLTNELERQLRETQRLKRDNDLLSLIIALK